MNKWDVLKDVRPRLEVSAVAKRTKKATTKTRRQKSAANTQAPLGPGPGKRALRGKLGRISRNHKRRSVWFQARAAWPLRGASVGSALAFAGRAQRGRARDSSDELEDRLLRHRRSEPLGR